MLEYGIKVVTTNPTLITKASEVIRLVDSRNHHTRAFVITASYEDMLKDFFKKIEYKKWVEEKKKALEEYNVQDAPSKALMEKGWSAIEDYLND